MIVLKTNEELTQIIAEKERVVLFFTADWCPDCQFIYPVMPEVEKAFASLTFVRVDRDDFIELAKQWNIFGIPSFVVLEKGAEIGRFVDKNRKTKAEITAFLEKVIGD